MEIAFDILSDLSLDSNDDFNWENKATSLYCIIAGNISSDNMVIARTLTHLSKFYQGVFYIDGYQEFQETEDISENYEIITSMIDEIPNVVHLRAQIVVLNGIAILGANGWYGIPDHLDKIEYDVHRLEDLAYLTKGIEQLQVHNDVKKILVVTSSTPNPDLFFGEYPKNIFDYPPINLALSMDTEKKVSHWIFGSYKKTVDIALDNINYVNNHYTKGQPYWPKRISINQ